MPNNIALLVDGKRVENFLGYTVDADIYVADHAFSLDLANPEAPVQEGKQCRLLINESQELTGVIDRVTKGYDKAGLKLRVEGRDLMGLLVDSCCEEFITVEGMDLRALAERLLATVPMINRQDIVFQENPGADAETPLAFTQIEPGQTVFEVLKEYARSRGLMFWGQPDGTFVFGRPTASGRPVFNLVTKKMDGAANNMMEVEEVRDISRRYSKITVVGQQQGLDTIGVDDIATGESVSDPDFPFYKPYVTVNNNDAASPALEARMLLEKQRQEGYRLTVKVAGHQQHGKNWAINTLCSVDDEILGVRESLLIYGRTFEMTKAGVFTTLRLGPPGMMES